MAERRAYVYKDSDGNYRVFPGVVVLDDKLLDDKFKLINMADVDFDVTIPEDAFGKDIPKKLLKKGAKDKGDRIGPLKGKNGGAYSYVVFDPLTGKKAQGNSDPVIIIDM